jgi:uncharacterized protein (TIGR00661 family)
MNILYGVCGEGFGHSSRAIAVASYLEQKGNKIKIITYSQGYDALKNRFDIFQVKGLHMVFEKNILKKRKTIAQNIDNFSVNLKRLNEFDSLIKDFPPDLCISDMEPIVPIISNWYSLPLISFDNQHRISHLKFNVPKEDYADYILAKEIIKAIAKKADQVIITSFAEMPLKDKYKRNTTIVPPIIREEIKNIKPKEGNKILVYLTKKNDAFLEILKDLNKEFTVYGYNTRKKEGNLKFKLSKTFLEDLSNCKAVIGTAGYTLISESIYLKKPYFAIPLGGQFEQLLNAIFIKNAGFGDYSKEPAEKDLVYFLYKLKDYRKKLKEYNPDYNKIYKILDKILRKVQMQKNIAKSLIFKPNNR